MYKIAETVIIGIIKAIQTQYKNFLYPGMQSHSQLIF